MKRASYLARLTGGAKGQSALQPPRVIFRPSVVDASGFVESTNEFSPVRAAAPQSSPNTARAERAAIHGSAPRPQILRNPASATATVAGPRESLVALSSARDVGESRSSARIGPRVQPMSASVPPAARPASEYFVSHARANPLPPDRPEPRIGARLRENRSPSATLMPPAPSERVTLSSKSGDRGKSSSENGVSVRIGTLEVRISPPPAPAPAQFKSVGSPRAPAHPRKESLARGFGSFGIVQG